MREQTWRTGQDVPTEGTWQCQSCSQSVELQEGDEFPPCPAEKKAVSWREPVLALAGGRQSRSDVPGATQAEEGSEAAPVLPPVEEGLERAAPWPAEEGSEMRQWTGGKEQKPES